MNLTPLNLKEEPGAAEEPFKFYDTWGGCIVIAIASLIIPLGLTAMLGGRVESATIAVRISFGAYLIYLAWFLYRTFRRKERRTRTLTSLAAFSTGCLFNTVIYALYVVLIGIAGFLFGQAGVVILVLVGLPALGAYLKYKKKKQEELAKPPNEEVVVRIDQESDKQ